MTANFTTVGTPTYAAGKFGNAATTAVGNYYTYSDASQFRSTTGLTVEYWAKTSSTSGYQIILGRAGNEWFGFNAGKACTSIGALTSATAYADGAWHHYAWTLDGTTCRLYIDGVASGSVASTISTQFWPATGGGNMVSIGAWASASAGTTFGNNFLGAIDELHVSKNLRYTAAFTPATTATTSDTYTMGLYHLEADGTDSTGAAGTGDTTAPTVPGTPVATAGNASASVAFTASTDAVGVTGYRVYSSADSYTAIAATGASSPIVVTGLTNGTAYTFQVTAYDAAGNASAKSAASNSVTPTAVVTAPGAPTSLTATSGNTQVGLSWTAPASNGGAAITDYLIEYQPSGGSWATFADGTSTATTTTVTGLTNGTAYSFRVSAINSAGTSTASSTATATPAVASTGIIAPNDTNIVYSPYQWDVSSTVAQVANSGAYFRTTIAGSPTTITANFTNTSNVTYVARIDGGPWTARTALTSTVALTPTSNGWTKHEIEFVFTDLNNAARWTTPLQFTGLTLSPTSATTTTTRRAPYNILCFGDSILEGYAADTPLGTGHDARFGWGYRLGELLGAEIGVVGWSGQGWTKTGVGSVPVFSSTYNLKSSGISRAFNSPTEPNLVVINMGTNDNGADITSAATTVLNGILAATTTTKIAVVLPFNGTLYKTTLQSVIAATTAPSRITFIDTTGWLSTSDTSDTTHPWGYVNLTDLTPRLATALTPALAGATVTGGSGTTVTPKRFVNVGGTAKAIA